MNTEKFSESKPILAYDGTVINADGTTFGESIDTKGYRSLVIPLDLTRTTDGQIDSIGFQESSDNNVSDAWADVDDSENLYYPDDFPVALTGVVHVGSVAKERYVRLKFVASAFTSGNIAIPKTLGFLQDALTKPERKESSVIADADVLSPDQTADAVTTPPKRT